jgi:DnaJ-class molecular chaperone
MAKSKTRKHAFICETCKGNGYIKIIHDNNETNVHQCWTCDSKGEFYVDESEVVESYIDAHYITDDDIKLH